MNTSELKLILEKRINELTSQKERTQLLFRTGIPLKFINDTLSLNQALLNMLKNIKRKPLKFKRR